MERIIRKKWSTRFIVITVILAIALLAVAQMLFRSASHAASPVGNWSVLPGHLASALQNSSPMHAAASNDTLQLSVALNLRNRSALNQLLADQNNPQSLEYHQYITPQEFADRFGADQATIDAVVAYLQNQGLHVGAISPNHLFIDASGSVTNAQHAFNVNIADYALGTRTVYAPMSEPSVPASLAGMVLNVGGLDNVAQYHPLGLDQAKQSAAPHTGPGGGFTPSELRTAYDANSLISGGGDGTGQTVAIFELDGYNPSDINTYLSNYNLGAPNYSNVLVDGATNTAGAGAIEVELDMEVVSAIAPNATQKIYIGPNSTQGVNDTYNQIVTDDVAKVTSTSWGECESASGNSELQALDNIFAQGAAQGQAFFAASGDSGAYDCNNGRLAVDSPADDPNVVGVGGTTLQVAADGTYGSESVWGNPQDTQRSPKGAGGGGGISKLFAEPAYQKSAKITLGKTKRTVPDVSADADPATGYSVFCTATAAQCPASGWIAVGGTSAAAPLWASIALDTNEFLVGQGKPALGTANTQLYTLFSAAQTFSAFHDVTTGNNLHYAAKTGYDLATGIGTPDAWNIARDLAS